MFFYKKTALRELTRGSTALETRHDHMGVFFLLKSGMGAVLKQPKRELTPAALYELFDRYGQCVLDQSGKCPLLVFTRHL